MGGGRRSRSLLFGACAATALLAGAPVASAKTITVGSPLTAGFTPTAFGPIITVTHVALPEPGANVTSPSNGTIVSWKVIAAEGGPLTLRVIHPLDNVLFTATGKATSGPITGTGVHTFQTSLPIRAGDRIGIQPTLGQDKVGFNTGVSDSAYAFWQPALGDNTEGRAPSVASAKGEVGFNAQVEPNCVVPKLKGRKLKKSTKLLENVNCGRGTISGRRKGKVKRQSPKAGTELAPGADVNLTLK